MFHSVGCVVCHSPRDDSGKEITHEGVVELGHLPAKSSLASLGDFLLQPARIRPSGRMPDMKLTPVEAKAVASYLLGKADVKAVALDPQEKLVALGKEQFQRLNCVACHKLGDIPAAKPVGTLEGSDTTRGWNGTSVVFFAVGSGPCPGTPVGIWYNRSVATLPPWSSSLPTLT